MFCHLKIAKDQQFYMVQLNSEPDVNPNGDFFGYSIFLVDTHFPTWSISWWAQPQTMFHEWHVGSFPPVQLRDCTGPFSSQPSLSDTSNTDSKNIVMMACGINALCKLSILEMFSCISSLILKRPKNHVLAAKYYQFVQ